MKNIRYLIMYFFFSLQHIKNIKFIIDFWVKFGENVRIYIIRWGSELPNIDW